MHTAVIVAYTGVTSVNKTEIVATVQIAMAGERRLGQTQRMAREYGSPPSRANANAILDAEVTVANPQRYCAG